MDDVSKVTSRPFEAAVDIGRVVHSYLLAGSETEGERKNAELSEIETSSVDKLTCR